MSKDQKICPECGQPVPLPEGDMHNLCALKKSGRLRQSPAIQATQPADDYGRPATTATLHFVDTCSVCGPLPKSDSGVAFESKGIALCSRCVRAAVDALGIMGGFYTVQDTPDLRHRLARAVLDDLEDRRGIKWEVEGVKESHPETYAEIERAIAENLMQVIRTPSAPEPVARPPHGEDPS
jgi:hypothetical protein